MSQQMTGAAALVAALESAGVDTEKVEASGPTVQETTTDGWRTYRFSDQQVGLVELLRRLTPLVSQGLKPVLAIEGLTRAELRGGALRVRCRHGPAHLWWDAPQLSRGLWLRAQHALAVIVVQDARERTGNDLIGNSPTIKRLFGDPGNFGMMVQRGYPMVWDNADVRFLDLREIAGNLWQQVMIRDANGGLHMLDYQMIETEDGWQINAVQLLPAPDVGA